MPELTVFISHSSQDDPVVRDLRQALEALHIATWADSEHLAGGDPLTPKIKSEIEKADRFLVLITLNALNSPWVKREIDHAQTVKKSGYKIVPLLGPGIGPPALKLLFPEEPVAIPLDDGPAPVMHALPEVLAALGIQPPTELVRRVQAKLAPAADLVLELTAPRILETEGKRRAAAQARLVYNPPDASPKVKSPPYGFTSPLGPIEAEELRWYLESYINWPAGLFQDRAGRVVADLPRWGRLIYDCVSAEAARGALHAWQSSCASLRRFTVEIEKRIDGAAPERQAEDTKE